MLQFGRVVAGLGREESVSMKLPEMRPPRGRGMFTSLGYTLVLGSRIRAHSV